MLPPVYEHHSCCSNESAGSYPFDCKLCLISVFGTKLYLLLSLQSRLFFPFLNMSCLTGILSLKSVIGLLKQSERRPIFPDIHSSEPVCEPWMDMEIGVVRRVSLRMRMVSKSSAGVKCIFTCDGRRTAHPAG